MATIQDIADKLGVSKGTVSKAINNAPDISETLRKTILDTAVEMGYSRLRRQKNEAKKFCIIIENMEYEELLLDMTFLMEHLDMILSSVFGRWQNLLVLLWMLSRRPYKYKKRRLTTSLCYKMIM